MNVVYFWSARVEIQGGHEYIYGMIEMENITPDNKADALRELEVEVSYYANRRPFQIVSLSLL